MGTYFLDTSALVKRYVTEKGSDLVMTLCQQKANNTVIISQATLVEAIAAFCRKSRETDLQQRITKAQRHQFILLIPHTRLLPEL